LLNLARQIQFTLEAFALQILFHQARVLDADGGHRGERRQDRQMILRKFGFGERRVRIDHAEDAFAHSERDGQHGADALNRHRARHETRVVLRVGGQHGTTLPDNFFNDRAADAHLADLLCAVPQLCHADFEFRVGILEHDQATLGGHRFKDQRGQLPQSLVERCGREQRDADFADQGKQVALLHGGPGLRGSDDRAGGSGGGARFLAGGLRARVFDGFEQAGGRALTGVERDGRFGQRRSGIGDHGGGSHLFVFKDDLGFADLDAPAGRERQRRFNARAVVERAVGRPQILQDVHAALAPHFGMDARSERVGDAHIIARRAANGDAQASERKRVGSAVGIINDEIRHNSK
jgi:hypothetical protein